MSKTLRTSYGMADAKALARLFKSFETHRKIWEIGEEEEDS
jgi:hypothetical protein